jgi:hypothetical protein
METLVPPLVINGTLKKIRALFVELQKGNGKLVAPKGRTTGNVLSLSLSLSLSLWFSLPRPLSLSPPPHSLPGTYHEEHHIYTNAYIRYVNYADGAAYV